MLRLFLDDSPAQFTAERDTIVQLETNLDDLTPQAYETTMERLFAAGAVDVLLTPVIMKHGRPAIMLTALAPQAKMQAVVAAILHETTTLGVRVQEMARYILPRKMESVQVRGATVHIKVADLGDGRTKAAPEYRDCKRLAEQTGLPLRDILEEAALAWRRQGRGAVRKEKKR